MSLFASFVSILSFCAKILPPNIVLTLFTVNLLCADKLYGGSVPQYELKNNRKTPNKSKILEGTHVRNYTFPETRFYMGALEIFNARLDKTDCKNEVASGQ